MNDPALESVVLGAAAVFARLAGVFLIAPGLSSLRIPMRVRLYVALAVSWALLPLLIDDAASVVEGTTPATILRLLGTETLIGLLIGLLARVLSMALETMAVAIANMTGIGGIPSVTVDGPTPAPAAATMFTTTALTLIFVADLHYEILRGLLSSYTVLPPGAGLNPRDALSAVADQFSAAFFAALRMAAPFFIYALIFNLAVGILNKFTPQIPVFFVALPFMIAGGLFLMALSVKEMMIAFMDAFRQLVGGL